MCTAARSEICDQRERGVHERRRSPKQTSLLRPPDARRSGALPRERRARRGVPTRARGPACLPGSGRLFTLHDASRGRGGAGARSSARSRRKGCIRQSRSISAGFTVDAPNVALGTAIKLPPRMRPARGRDHRSAGAASPTADAAKRRSAAAPMQPQNSFLCAGRAIYSFSPRAATKQL